MIVTLPTALTPLGVLVALWVAAASDRVPGARVAGAVAAATLAAGYTIWRRRGRRWHDGRTIVALVPSIACGVWIAVGGLVTATGESDARRLLLEVGPGLAIVGIAATILGYHGRHHPLEDD